jgi:hypothetical protein
LKRQIAEKLRKKDEEIAYLNQDLPETLNGQLEHLLKGKEKGWTIGEKFTKAIMHYSSFFDTSMVVPNNDLAASLPPGKVGSIPSSEVRTEKDVKQMSGKATESSASSWTSSNVREASEAGSLVQDPRSYALAKALGLHSCVVEVLEKKSEMNRGLALCSEADVEKKCVERAKEKQKKEEEEKKKNGKQAEKHIKEKEIEKETKKEKEIENDWSKAFWEKLSVYFSGRADVTCQKKAQNKTQSDIQVCFRENNQVEAVVLFEVGLVQPGWRGDPKKFHQGVGNVGHYYKEQENATYPVFSVELYVSKVAGARAGVQEKVERYQVIGAQITGYVINRNGKLGRAMLFKDMKVSEANLKVALEALFKVCDASLTDEAKRWKTYGKNVAECGGVMLKSYFYKDHLTYGRTEIDASERRSPYLSSQLIQGAKMDEKGVILTYPKIDGQCGDFSTKEKIVKVLEELKSLHEKGVIMGDIRRRNIIGARFIDFDYSKVADSEKWEESKCEIPENVLNRRYPSGWHKIIDDGARHPGALEMKEILPIHDVYAICAAILRGLVFSATSEHLIFGLVCVLIQCESGVEEYSAEQILKVLIGFVSNLNVILAEADVVPGPAVMMVPGTPPSSPNKV